MQLEQETLDKIRARCARDALLLERVSLAMRSLSDVIDTERYDDVRTLLHGASTSVRSEPVMATVVVAERRRSAKPKKRERVDLPDEPKRRPGGGRPRRQYDGFEWCGLKARHAQYRCLACEVMMGCRAIERHRCCTENK